MDKNKDKQSLLNSRYALNKYGKIEIQKIDIQNNDYFDYVIHLQFMELNDEIIKDIISILIPDEEHFVYFDNKNHEVVMNLTDTPTLINWVII